MTVTDVLSNSAFLYRSRLRMQKSYKTL